MSTRPSGPFIPTEAYIQRMADDLAATASHPEFLQMIHGVQCAPISEKLVVAQDVARIERLCSKGIPIPDTFRITTRTFEDPEPEVAFGDIPTGAPQVTFDGRGGSVAYRGLVITVSEKKDVISELGTTDIVEAEIKKGITAIGEFVASPAFQDVLAELAELKAEERPQFVVDELLDPVKQTLRGLDVPDGMHLQRSHFADGRPTLFCVSKVLPLAYPWHKVTITFDNA